MADARVRLGNSRNLSSRIPRQYLANETAMQDRAVGTCIHQVPSKLRWGVDVEEADEIACHNRDYAEFSGYFEIVSSFLKEARSADSIVFRDSVSGEGLFQVPGKLGKRTIRDFLRESYVHGWPSFRDDEVFWESGVRMLENGEIISVHTGVHLGHLIPDEVNKNRYCINLVSIAGTESMYERSQQRDDRDL